MGQQIPLKRLVRLTKKTLFYFSFMLPLFYSKLAAQELSSIKDTTVAEKQKPDKITFLAYERIIANPQGMSAIRTDQNFVGNFKLINWLKLEAGIRFGERPYSFDAYYHYKLELQSKSFWKIVRVIARVSDNIINFPSPSYRKTNKLFAIEAKYPLSKSFQVFAGLGYVFSSQQNKEPDFLPTNKGVQNNYPIFKIGLKYMVNKKNDIELAYGSYDVFNPYLLNSPFVQLSGNFDLSKVCTLYSYFRYQYANNNVFMPFGYFFTAGILFHLVKG